MSDLRENANNLVKKIGIKIKERRVSLGLSTREFAQGIPGLQSSNLSEIERGERRPTINMVVGICQKYGIPIGELVETRLAYPTFTTKAKSRLLPVYGNNHVLLLFGGEGGERGVNEIETDQYFPAPTTDALSFYYMVDTHGCSCPKSLAELRAGDLLLVEPNKKVNNGDPVLAIGRGTVLICSFHKEEDGSGTILVCGNGAEVIRLSHRAANEYKFYRVTAIMKNL